MIIICDNIDFAVKNGFGNYDDYSILKDNSIKIITDVLFGKNKKVCFSIDKRVKFWNYLFIIEFAEESQYDAIISLAQSKNIPDKLLCLAGSGKNFHGFHQRKWEALQGNIHLTAYFKPNQKIENFGTGFLILSAISVVQSIDEIMALKHRATIKWVNDILIDNSKVSGVLAHAMSKGEIVTDAILGIGLNVESKPNIEATSFIPNSACLNDFLSDDTKVEVKDVLVDLMNHLASNYILLSENKYGTLLEMYKNRMNIFGKNIIVMTDERDGSSKFSCEGRVNDLGDNLEIFLDGVKEPITGGRIIIKG
ncbi:MAG: hypothetical protein V1779_13265 [bacterium]